MLNLRQRILALLLSLLMLLGTCSLALSDEAEAPLMLEGKYYSPGDKENIRSWLFPYDDSYFSGDDSVYNHKLAQASLGMALSAFRNTKKPYGQQQENIVSYLQQAGFSNLRQDGYDRKPEADTISTMIGMKKIGNATVIATAVCGGGYGNEWKSNFLVEDETRSQGFHNASKMVQERIRNYLTDNNITGEVYLWIAGYSRAAATSNITAADMTDSGLFTKVFAYTFATPNVTREKGNYTNIFNIIGKTDPVPSVPLRDWGYQHYGIDLYTPAQEYDSDYNVKKARATEISLQLAGSKFRNNPVINNTLHNVLDYLLATYPTSAIYQSTLGSILIAIWGGDSEQIIEVLEKALEYEASMPAEETENFNKLVSYIDTSVTRQLRTQDQLIKEGLWDANVGLADNVVHEHNPDVYVDWMFSSDDPEEIFSSDADSYYRFILYGNVTVDVYDLMGFVEQIQPNGKIIRDASQTGDDERMSSTCPELYASVENGMLTLLIPKDQIYAIGLTSSTEQEVKYAAPVYSLGTLLAELGDLHTVTLNAGETYYLIAEEEFYPVNTNGSEVITGILNSELYSPSIMIQLESMNVLNLSMVDILWIAFLVVLVLALLMVVEIILTIVRLIRRKHRKDWVTIVTHGFLVLFFFTLAELSRYYLNAITTVYIVMKSIAAFWVALLGLKAALDAKKRLGFMIFAALLFAVAGDIATDSKFSLIFFFGFMAVLLAGILMEKRPSLPQTYLGLGLWFAFVVVLIVLRSHTISYLRYFIPYTLLMIFLPLAAWKIHPLMFVGCLCFSISNVLIGLNLVFDLGFTFRAIGVGYYLTATFLLAMTPFFLNKKKKDPQVLTSVESSEME